MWVDGSLHPPKGSMGCSKSSVSPSRSPNKNKNKNKNTDQNKNKNKNKNKNTDQNGEESSSSKSGKQAAIPAKPLLQLQVEALAWARVGSPVDGQFR